MSRLTERLARLERGRVGPTAADRAAACTRITAEIYRLSSSFDEAVAVMPLEDRLRLSPAAHFAWALRFAPTPLATILQLHGLGGRHATV